MTLAQAQIAAEARSQRTACHDLSLAGATVGFCRSRSLQILSAFPLAAGAVADRDRVEAAEFVVSASFGIGDGAGRVLVASVQCRQTGSMTAAQAIWLVMLVRVSSAGLCRRSRVRSGRSAACGGGSESRFMWGARSAAAVVPDVASVPGGAWPIAARRPGACRFHERRGLSAREIRCRFHHRSDQARKTLFTNNSCCALAAGVNACGLGWRS